MVMDTITLDGSGGGGGGGGGGGLMGVFQRWCLTSAGGVPERGRGLGQSLVYNRVHVFGQVDR